MTVLKHAVSELMASVPHRKSLKSLSLGPDESWFGQFSSIHPPFVAQRVSYATNFPMWKIKGLRVA